MNKSIISIISGMVFGSVITAVLAFIIWPEKIDDGSIVPEFDDVKNIIINGEKFTASQFSEKYCYGKARHTFKDESYCGTAMTEASIQARQNGSLFKGRPIPQRYETPNDRYNKKLEEEKSIKEKSQ